MTPLGFYESRYWIRAGSQRGGGSYWDGGRWVRAQRLGVRLPAGAALYVAKALMAGSMASSVRVVRIRQKQERTGAT